MCERLKGVFYFVSNTCGKTSNLCKPLAFQQQFLQPQKLGTFSLIGQIISLLGHVALLLEDARLF